MKNKKISAYIFFSFGSLMIILAIAPNIFQKKQSGETHAPQPIILENTIVDKKGERENITFILGKDDEPGENYFTAAEAYYRMDKKEGTEQVITACQSILEVRNFLEKNAPTNGRPWGKINLVAHGNEWSGLSVPTLPEEKRTTVISLKKAKNNGQIKSLPVHLADAKTELHVHGCAVGRNTELTEALRHAFADKRNMKVKSTPFFVKYEKGNSGKENRRKEYEGFYAFYPKTYRPSDEKLVRQLEKRYPTENIDWSTALQKSEDSGDGIYHHVFHIPLIWVVAYPDKESVPDLSKWKAQKTWLAEQSELKEMLRAYDIPQEHFQWTFLNVNHELKDGTKVPAIRAIGLCSVLTVLKEVEE